MVSSRDLVERLESWPPTTFRGSKKRHDKQSPGSCFFSWGFHNENQPRFEKNHGKFRNKNLHFPLKKLKNGFEKTCRAWCATQACSSPETADDFGCLFGPFLIKIYRCFFNKPKVGVQEVSWRSYRAYSKIVYSFSLPHVFCVFFVRFGDLSPKKSTQKTGYGVGERCWILKSSSGNC